ELDKVGINDIDLVGGKNASLGEMLQHLSVLGVSIPNGFVITIDAYWDFIEYNGLKSAIKRIINSIDFNSVESLCEGGRQVRSLITKGSFPDEMQKVIIDGYFILSKNY